ncbi:response regulator [Allohahella sp. A8]|uniref:response regulator n=1 Tax=Allohahella sp. A8 TaxID=3141461 RepID=UPI000C0A8FFF|nr:DNA-binding response regulator [Hahellaceae bacterium]
MIALQPKILVIDDEPQILRFLRISLRSEGYQFLEAADGTSGLEVAAIEDPEVIVLDLGLPDMDGFAVLQELRRWSRTPVLVLSVRSSEQEKVRALDLGANDYVTKPFGIKEFMARLRVLIRDSAQGASNLALKQFDSGALRIDFVKRIVTLAGEPLHLSRKEYALLGLLARHADHVVTQQYLLSEIWGASHSGDSHYLRIFIARLRQKLQDDPTQPRFIQTEQGVGYRLVSEQ